MHRRLKIRNQIRCHFYIFEQVVLIAGLRKVGFLRGRIHPPEIVHLFRAQPHQIFFDGIGERCAHEEIRRGRLRVAVVTTNEPVRAKCFLIEEHSLAHSAPRVKLPVVVSFEALHFDSQILE